MRHSRSKDTCFRVLRAVRVVVALVQPCFAVVTVEPLICLLLVVKVKDPVALPTLCCRCRHATILATLYPTRQASSHQTGLGVSLLATCSGRRDYY